MDSIQLKKFFKKSDEQLFSGVYAADTLPSKIIIPVGLIVNTAPKTNPGDHWVAIFIDGRRNGYYFDSFGRPPMVQSILTFLRRNSINLMHNTKQIQHLNSTKCGQFSAVYLKFRFASATPKRFLDLFNHDLSLNEKIINSYYNYFTQ
jgi:Adenovirus endoprotease